MSAKQPKKPSSPSSPSSSRRDELFGLTRDLLLTAVSAAGGAPRNEEQAREIVRVARAVQSEVNKPTPRPATSTDTPAGELTELSDDNF